MFLSVFFFYSFDSVDDEKPMDSLTTNEVDALRCITIGGGDVAFIDFNALESYLRK